ncbi:type I-G CRISPR-associated helicase/endonuclease Cas3g [Planctopirus hydrillae]|uniref:CRISPR-associated endonuclease Cas3 n=1 Tax=Planctopirus hydrillae TaxID=1841610 RepID=A0A1C3EFX1_9PLAN|nr:CRISPR-associated endonuclease Cas3'' [Planctopirus hydrillae]ODA32152.1 CRISPR-associated endonuclease Cas3'' [Planctopirus hydrillae]
MKFDSIFHIATGQKPYPYQERFATADSLPELLNVPTGVGKTATAILGWLYRRQDKKLSTSTPRRLIYCLPMRVLVEQTIKCAKEWREKLGLVDSLGIHVLMGGANSDDWDTQPDEEAIIVGTQDMLLSRALNRGYGMSRYRWPVHFGLLNNDCLWIMDETQLMGVGLTTTAQLQGLRSKLKTFGITHSVWMSATLDSSPLNTVDHPEPVAGYSRIQLEEDDVSHPEVSKRLQSVKSLKKVSLTLNAASEKGYAKELAAVVTKSHQRNSLTLVVVNRVPRAQSLFEEITKLAGKNKDLPQPALIHSRFRPVDRKEHEQKLFASEIPASGTIVVATQAVEAGVDVSSKTLFTELAPWPSLVQRFGRCNRKGEYSDAQVFWIGIEPKSEGDKFALPYLFNEYEKSRGYLKSLKDVGPESLKVIQDQRPQVVAHTLRRKDLLDLWDTTTDLAGNDLDVSRYIREGDDTDIQFYWRAFEGNLPEPTQPAPLREELCSVAIDRAKEFLKKSETKALLWNPLDREWGQIESNSIRPGQVLLLKLEQGGYSKELGWTGNPKDQPTVVPLPENPIPLDANDADELGSGPVTLTKHLQDVEESMVSLAGQLASIDDSVPWNSLQTAARWHDVGKAHPAFQSALKLDESEPGLWAKSGRKGLIQYEIPNEGPRPGFRHELASALVWLKHHPEALDTNLVAFLIAAHHGKVRGSIRSLPNEKPPADRTKRFARGLHEGDVVPPVNLGNGETTSETAIDLSLMELGESESQGESWLSRVLALRDEFGPFRLSYLESLIRIADWHGSALPQPKIGAPHHEN